MTDNKITALGNFLELNGFKKEAYMASLLPMLTWFGCGSDYDLREVAENNMENMFSPECIGSIHMPYNHEDFARGEIWGIPTEEFVSTYRSYDKTRVEFLSIEGSPGNYRSINDYIEGYVCVIFQNIPLMHPSWEQSDCLSKIRDGNSSSWEDWQSGERLYIRDVAFNFPRLKIRGNDVVFANAKQVECYFDLDFCSSESSWYSECHSAWNVLVGINGTSQEDNACREAVRRFFEEGPKDAEENM